MSGNPEEETFADGIVTIEGYDAPTPLAKEFLAWHRPRKQYVRQHQWCEQIERLLSDAPPQDGTLKYLGLPGVDLLDLRYFHAAVCSERNLKLRFLGFNSSARPKSAAHTELNISMDEVRRLSGVDPMSDVVIPPFLVEAKSGAMRPWPISGLG